MSWNLFHGRDHPPDPLLRTLRSRVLGVPEVKGDYAQVNRPLLDEFAEVIARAEWDLLLLQELPPRWIRPLAERSGASAGATALTARNFGASLRAWIAERNPDLIASGEGGSNGMLARPPWRLADVRRLTLTRTPERRRMLWARLETEGHALGAATLHTTAHDERASARDVLNAAEHAHAWTGALPLVFGGDFNLKPATAPEAFATLAARYGLEGVTAPRRIDHVLARGLERLGPTRVLPPSWREVRDGGSGRLLRLSDHDAIAADFALPSR